MRGRSPRQKCGALGACTTCLASWFLVRTIELVVVPRRNTVIGLLLLLGNHDGGAIRHCWWMWARNEQDDVKKLVVTAQGPRLPGVR